MRKTILSLKTKIFGLKLSGIILCIVNSYTYGFIYHYDLKVGGLAVEKQNGEITNASYEWFDGEVWIDYDEEYMDSLTENENFSWMDFDMHYEISSDWTNYSLSGDGRYSVGWDDTYLWSDSFCFYSMDGNAYHVYYYGPYETIWAGFNGSPGLYQNGDWFQWYNEGMLNPIPECVPVSWELNGNSEFILDGICLNNGYKIDVSVPEPETMFLVFIGLSIFIFLMLTKKYS